MVNESHPLYANYSQLIEESKFGIGTQPVRLSRREYVIGGIGRR